MIDVSSEAKRRYHYKDGSTFTIEEPREVHVINDEKGVTHRIIAADGWTYRPERGWVAISWQPKADAPAFVA